MTSISRILMRHRPSITLKSYGSCVNYCLCEHFTPKGDDEKSWKEWARHVAEEIEKAEERTA